MTVVALPDPRLLRTIAALIGIVADLERRPLTFDRLHDLTPLLDGPTRRMIFDRLAAEQADACWRDLDGREAAG
jgi:hypothetical protein